MRPGRWLHVAVPKPLSLTWLCKRCCVAVVQLPDNCTRCSCLWHFIERILSCSLLLASLLSKSVNLEALLMQMIFSYFSAIEYCTVGLFSELKPVLFGQSLWPEKHHPAHQVCFTWSWKFSGRVSLEKTSATGSVWRSAEGKTPTGRLKMLGPAGCAVVVQNTRRRWHYHESQHWSVVWLGLGRLSRNTQASWKCSLVEGRWNCCFCCITGSESFPSPLPLHSWNSSRWTALQPWDYTTYFWSFLLSSVHGFLSSLCKLWLG